MGEVLHCHGGETNLPSVTNRVSFAAHCYTVFFSGLSSVFEHKCTNFLQFSFVLEVKKCPELDMSSIGISPFLKKEKPITYLSFSCCNMKTMSAAFFLSRKENSTAARCSFKSDITKYEEQDMTLLYKNTHSEQTQHVCSLEECVHNFSLL